MAESLNQGKYLVARVGTELDPRGVQHSKDGSFAFRVSLQPIYHRPYLFVNNLTVGIPNNTKDTNGGLHRISRGRINRSVVVHVSGIGSSPSLKVKTTVGIFGIDRVSKGFELDIGKCGADVEALLTLDEVVSVDGTDHGTSQDVVCGVQILVHGFRNRLRFDILLGFLEHVELGILVEFQVLEHGRCRLDGFNAGCRCRRRRYSGESSRIAR
mmetsp:Transcript_19650/g.42727  ORF Transcript_19650/g.42727 Transcript_19650/m.42727 type:complete len:213 (-) Transcript_19650:182-820(-)